VLLPNPIWSLDHSDLEKALKHAWEDLDDPDSENLVQAVKSLPEISGPSSEKFPYRLLEDGSPTLYIPSSDIPAALNTVKLAGKERRPCHFCGETFRISEMRNHVGAHILKAQRGVADFSLIVGKEVSSFRSYTITMTINFLQIGINPCGWCGNEQCKTRLTVTGNSTKITSDCEYHYQNMKYRLAMTSTDQTPCTNVPLNCPMCPPQSDTFWKYGFISHIADRHLTESIELPSLDISLDLWVTTHISKWEEFRMGIPTFKTDEWRVSNEFPDSDVVQIIRDEMVDSGEEGEDPGPGGMSRMTRMSEHNDAEQEVVVERHARKRTMSTVSTLSRQGSPTKRTHHGL
jgi:hypothetical protein